jgi:hypothetical protein
VAADEAFSSAVPVSGMRPKEANLGAYLLARAATQQKIEGPVLENLRAGHTSVQEVDALLPLGRANVREDLAKMRSERPLQRHQASRRLRWAMEEMHGYRRGTMVGDENSRLTAATSQYAKAGVCLSYASNTTALHGAKLPGMKDEGAIVAQARHEGFDHVWSEYIPGGKGANGKPVLHREDVIMDGWCDENIAILREDGNFAELDRNGRGRHLSHDHLLDHQTGPQALARVNQFKAQIEGSQSLQNTFHSHLMHLVAEGSKEPKHGLWNATTIFNDDFRDRATDALHPEKPLPGDGVGTRDAGSVAVRFGHTVLLDMHAVGVARSLGANIRGALAEAPVITASARAMFPLPEPENESVLSRLSAYLWG